MKATYIFYDKKGNAIGYTNEVIEADLVGHNTAGLKAKKQFAKETGKIVECFEINQERDSGGLKPEKVEKFTFRIVGEGE